MTDPFEVPARFRAELGQALVTAVAQAHAAAPARRRRRLAPARLAPALALGAAVLATVLVLDSGGGLAPPAASAARVLRASAAALQRAGDPRALAPGDRDYLYTRRLIWWRYTERAHPYVVRTVDQSWVARDGSGREDTRTVGARGPGRASDVRLPASRHPFALGLDAFGPHVSYAQLRALASDPRALAATVHAIAEKVAQGSPLTREFGAGRFRAALVFEVARALAQAPATAAVRAGVYRLLADTPGVRLLGSTTDSAGRHGTAIAARLGAFEFTIVLDPATGELLQSSRTVLYRSAQTADAPVGLMNRATYLRSAVVASTTAAPR
jgi:hypothetical protein